MATEVLLPQLGLTMNEGIIFEWAKEEGDLVEKGDLLFIVESDKATIDVEAQEDGILGKIVVPEMETVPVGTVVGWLVQEGEDIPDSVPKVMDDNSSLVAADKAEEDVKEKLDRNSNDSSGNKDSYILSSPRARDVARKEGVNLSKISGSGPDGSIVEADILEYLANTKDRSVSIGNEVQLSRIQMLGAEKMLQSWSEIPQFTLYATIKAEPLLEAYRYSKESEETTVSLNVLFAKIIALAAQKYPYINSSWKESDKIKIHDQVNIGIAMDTEEGLIVPVLKGCETRSIKNLGTDWVSLSGRIKDKSYSSEDVTDATITLSNLGMFGISKFRAIINPPQAAILAIGEKERRAVESNGDIAFETVITVSLTADHRIIDGAYGAKFLMEIRKMIENPVSMFL